MGLRMQLTGARVTMIGMKSAVGRAWAGKLRKAQQWPTLSNCEREDHPRRFLGCATRPQGFYMRALFPILHYDEIMIRLRFITSRV